MWLLSQAFLTKASIIPLKYLYKRGTIQLLGTVLKRIALILLFAAPVLLIFVFTRIRVRPPTNTITGKVTAVYTDCGTRKKLGAGGSVVEERAGVCDAGSSIVVEGRFIQTSSSFGDLHPYDKHDPTLEPGMSVTVTYDTERSLRCSVCKIVKR